MYPSGTISLTVEFKVIQINKLLLDFYVINKKLMILA